MSLPSRPNLEQLKKQAKDLQKSFNSGEPTARDKIKSLHPRSATVTAGKLRLGDAQLVIAREHGFGSWARLKHHVAEQSETATPWEALAEAVQAGQLAEARRLLSEHAGLRRRLNEAVPNYAFGRTLLLSAVQGANREMIELLLEAGADINARSHWWAGGFGVLDDDHGLAEFLIRRGARLDAHAAARLGRLRELKELLVADPAAVHARGGDGQTPLHFASTVAIADCLLEHGADIDAVDIDHESTPAQYMVRERQDVARHLVARGCRTDILMAAALGDQELARRHLDSNPECVRLRVSEEHFPKRDPRAGGSIYIWTLGHNLTPHQVARRFGHEAVLRLLMERSPLELRFSQACILGELGVMRDILAAHPDLPQKLSEAERSQLVHAAQDTNVMAVRLMLSSGWPVDARDGRGRTALHWAAFHGNEELVRMILEYHPPLDCVDAEHHGTPLGWAIFGSEHGWFPGRGDYAGTVEALLAAGAQPPSEVDGSEAVRTILRRRLGKRINPIQEG